MNPFKIPQPVIDQMRELTEIIDTHRQFIPLPVVASFIGMKADTLRNSIDRGQCPFGISGQLGANRAYKIPTSSFFWWFVQGCGWKNS